MGTKTFGAKYVIPNEKAPSRMAYNPHEAADSDVKGIKRKEEAPGDEGKAARETEAQASDREESHVKIKIRDFGFGYDGTRAYPQYSSAGRDGGFRRFRSG